METCVAVVQMTSGDDLEDNLKETVKWLKKAVEVDKASLILLPECFSCFSSGNKKLADIRCDANRVREFLADQSRKLGVWIIAGTLICESPQSESKYPARSYVYTPEGLVSGFYDKIHLFDVEVNDSFGRYCESDTYLAGSDIVLVESSAGILGLSVCYDLRFPDLFCKLASMGAQILCVPAAFTHTTGQAHWEVLLRARAIENQCFVLAANQCGNHSNGKQTWGHSMIIDPWGQILASADEEPNVVSASIDVGTIEAIRTKMPCFSHRREDIYKKY